MVKQAKHAVQKRRDHACAHCAAAFGQASHLTRHVHAVHEKRRDHACPHCDAVFGEAGSLTTHVRVVHEKRRDHIESTRGPGHCRRSRLAAPRRQVI